MVSVKEVDAAFRRRLQVRITKLLGEWMAPPACLAILVLHYVRVAGGEALDAFTWMAWIALQMIQVQSTTLRMF